LSAADRPAGIMDGLRRDAAKSLANATPIDLALSSPAFLRPLAEGMHGKARRQLETSA